MKKGVTLMALAITIVVMLILLGTIVTGLSLTVTAAEMNTYAKDLKAIEDAVTIKMTQNNHDFLYGSTNGKVEVSRDALLASIPADKANNLTQEFTLNGDKNTSKFYIVNVDKLDLKRNKYGKAKALPDAIILAKDTSNVYYAKGKTFKGVTYFSLTEKLIDIANVSKEDLGVTADMNLQEKIVVKKMNHEYTNAIEFKVNTSMVNGSTVTVTCGTKEVDVTNKIVNGIYTLKDGNGFTANEIAACQEVVFKKKINGVIKDSVTVAIANFDSSAPSSLKCMLRDVGGDTFVVVNAVDDKAADVKHYLYITDTETEIVIPTTTSAVREKLIKDGKRTTGKSIAVTEEKTKIAIAAVDAAGNVGEPAIINLVKLGRPVAHKGLSAIYFPGGGETSISRYDPNWYNYTSSNPDWANAKTKDGSYWVWIPRYAYRIIYYDREVVGTETLVNARVLGRYDARGFVDANGNASTSFSRAFPKVEVVILGNGINKYKYTKGSEKGDVTKPYGKENPGGYVLHPAFTSVRADTYTPTGSGNYGHVKDIAGFWVSKYEIGVESGMAVSKPNTPPMTNINATTMYNKGQNLKNDIFRATHVEDYETMMMTNSQWGAVALLAISTSLKEYPVVPNNTDLTGDPNKSIYSSCMIDRSGVYDMSGGVKELMATYVANGNSVISTNGLSVLDNKDTKFVDVYRRGLTDAATNNYAEAKLFYGDATYETSTAGTGNTAFRGGASQYPNGAAPFITRGGYKAAGGVFAYETSSGAASSDTGWRAVIIPK